MYKYPPAPQSKPIKKELQNDKYRDSPRAQRGKFHRVKQNQRRDRFHPGHGGQHFLANNQQRAQKAAQHDPAGG